MAMDYEIIIPEKGVVHTTLGAACWASLPRNLRSHDGRRKEGTPFRCRLILDDRSSYMANTSTTHRNLSDEIFDKMFGTWMHPDWWISEHKTPNRKARSGIVYTSACPYWVMVASGSVYRMHSDFSSFIYFWEQIDKVQAMMGYKLRPWTQYFMCVSISNSINSSADFRTDAVTLSTSNGHMIIDGKHGSIETIQHLSGWTQEMLTQGDGVHDRLDSMYSQWRETDTLSHMGRDRFFTGFYPINAGDYIPNFIQREGKAAGISLSTTTNPYCTKDTAHIPEFIEKVCIPNQL